ncbi:hypothetical protein HYX05_01385 [Candidatus Woesearchaeota archaeon]|nr:hypothetical protein [Candidatus Woesearchaeota archaeon]
MGVFSDADVNDAWILAQQSNELLGLRKRDFINGFAEGWKKASAGSTPILIMLGGKAFSRFAELPIADSPRDFGEALGALIGALQSSPYHPLTSSDATESYIDLINRIKAKKKEFYALVRQDEKNQHNSCRDYH